MAAAAAGCGDGSSPRGDLVGAAGTGDLPAVRRLLAAGAHVDTRDARGRTAVTAAALGEHVDVARELIRAGADVDLQDDERNNPCSSAARPATSRCWARCCARARTSAARTASAGRR